MASAMSLIEKRDLMGHFSCFLEPRELAALEGVSRTCRQAVQPNWRIQGIIQNILPQVMPAGMTHGQMFKALYPIFIKDLYPDAFVARFYKDYFGDVGPVPPIPKKFIEKANCPDPVGNSEEMIKSNYQLVLIPAFITITVDKGSPLDLNENGKLVKDLPALDKRTLKIPVTLNNLAILAAGRVTSPTGLKTDPSSWENVLEQHGDKPVEQSYWSYQRRAAIGQGYSYNQQNNIVEYAGLKAAPLIDRFLFNLLTYVNSGKRLDGQNMARTSTPTLDSGIPPHPWPSSVWWPPDSGSLPCLALSTVLSASKNVGIAVELV